MRRSFILFEQIRRSISEAPHTQLLIDESLTSVFDVFEASQAPGMSFDETLGGAVSSGPGGSGSPGSHLDYAGLLGAEVGGTSPYLIAPFDHPDDHRLLVSGTGLTHTGTAGRTVCHAGVCHHHHPAGPRACPTRNRLHP